jgi:hypothetical protein
MPVSASPEITSTFTLNGPENGAPPPTTLHDVMEAGACVLAVEWHDPTKAEETKAYVKRMAKKYVRGLLQLRAAVDTGDKKRIRKRSFHVEHSLGGRFAAVLLGHAAKGQKLTLSTTICRAKELRLRSPTAEHVLAQTLPKPDGGHRVISSYGPMDTSAKRLGTDILQVVWGVSPYEYSRKGRGRDAAIRNALHGFNEGGVKRYERTDVKNFYPSVDKKWLVSSIPMAAAISRNVFLISDDKQIIWTHGDEASEATVRAGLPQGSRPSALIASKLIEAVVDGVQGVSLAISHGDDVLLGVAPGADAEVVRSALVSRFAKHPAGPFQLKIVEDIKLGRPNDFCGYMLRHRAAQYGGGARASASRKAILRQKKQVARKIVFVGRSHEEDCLTTYLEHWVKSFGEWGAGETAVDVAIAELQWSVFRVVNAFRPFVRKHTLTFHSLQEAADLFEAAFVPLIR